MDAFVGDEQTLDVAELASLRPLGVVRETLAGEFLFRSGDPTYDFYVVLSGAVDIVLDADDGEHVVVTHGANRFLGELNLLTGSRLYLSARVVQPGEVLVVPAAELRRVLKVQPTLSDKILAAFMARRAGLRLTASSATRVIGSRFSTESLRIREFLSRCQLPYEWVDPDHDEQIDALLVESGVTPADLPVVITAGAVLRRATPGVVAEYLGLTLGNLPERSFDLVVVGGGPAGLAAAVYGASEGLRTLGFDMVAPGGQAGTSSRIENYFGFPTGLSGSELMQRGLIQAEKFGAQLTTPCAAVALREEHGYLTVELSDASTVAGRAVIIATGARYRRLDVPRLAEFEGNGVYYAATDLEARLCAGSPVVVVGGGNSAGQAAVFLADQGSEVRVVIRKPDLAASMSRYLVDRLESHDRIGILAESHVVALDGDRSLQSIRVRRGDEEQVVECAAMFSFIGADPGTEWLSGCAALDSHGFVLTDRALTEEQLGERWAAYGRQPLPFETSHPGLFAVGDVRSGSMKRVAAAVGEGSSAVWAVHEHLGYLER